MIAPIVREFFRGLKERQELDVIVPQILTGMGLEIVSWPQIGPRQYGADVVAVGDDEDGERKLFLLTIKRGDLKRDDWNGTAQAVQQSLDDIRNVYLRNLSPEHEGLPIVLCVVVGGIVPQNVTPVVNGYFKRNNAPGVEHRLWTGDTLTLKLLGGALREEVFPPGRRDDLRRAAAMVSDPEVSAHYFERLLEAIAADEKLGPVDRVAALWISLWILFVWAREAGNLESAYDASELVVIRSWAMLWPTIERERGKQRAAHAFHDVAHLHLQIWDELYGAKIVPHAGARHALSVAAGSTQAVDINLAMFKTIGRLATGGLWRFWLQRSEYAVPRVTADSSPELVAIAKAIAAMPLANPSLFTPIAEDQAVDLSLALLLLATVPELRGHVQGWVRRTTQSVMACFVNHQCYPTIDGSYSNLIGHPAERTDEHRREATAGSMLFPLLALVAWSVRDAQTVRDIGAFQEKHLQHCNFQVWVPTETTEGKLWGGIRMQGASLGGLAVGTDASKMVETLRKECAANTAYPALSAVRLEHWPVLALACRRVRLPLPPQLWMRLLDDLREMGAQHADVKGPFDGED